MYAVGDYIVHPGQGVCQVKDVTESPNALYQLLPIGQRHPVHISFPVASEDRLRPVLTRDEAEKIIDDYPRMQLDDFAWTRLGLPRVPLTLSFRPRTRVAAAALFAPTSGAESFRSAPCLIWAAGCCPVARSSS